MPKKRKGRGGRPAGRKAKIPEAPKSPQESEKEDVDSKESAVQEPHRVDPEVKTEDSVEIMMIEESPSNDTTADSVQVNVSISGEYDIKGNCAYVVEKELPEVVESPQMHEASLQDVGDASMGSRGDAFDIEDEIPVFKFEKFGTKPAEELEHVQEAIEKIKIDHSDVPEAGKTEEMETDVSSSLPEATSTTQDADGVTPEATPESTPNIRRSTRIKSISKIKQRVQGHGIVRDKEKLLPKPQGEEPKQPVKVSAEEERVRKEAEEQRKREVEQKLKQFAPIRDNIYHCERNVSKEAKKMLCDCFLTQEDIERGELGCGEDCLNRLLMIECGSKCNVGDRCTNRRFQKYQYSQCRVFCTEKKGLGIMATDPIVAGDFVMEYVGEVLNSGQFDERAANYSKDKNIHYYFMALRSDAIIDATIKGNISRYINHSCDPNAETQKWTVNGELRVGFFATRDIAPGEEITFDYQYQRYGKEAQRCYCEAENCRGWIGEEPDSSEEEEDDDEDADDEESEAEVSPEEATEEKAPIEAAAAATKQAPKPRRREPKPREPKPPKKSPTRRRGLKKKRPEILEDPDLDDEIDLLTVTGLKNQAQTLKLSRLMVRAKVQGARSRLLTLLRNGELPCRRLFLDYHGLRLLSGWMVDGAAAQSPTFRLEILETLKALPIPNKTILKDTGVMGSVEKWLGCAGAPSPDDTSPSDKSTESPPSENSSAAQTPQTTPQGIPAPPGQSGQDTATTQEKPQPPEGTAAATTLPEAPPAENLEVINASIKDLGKNLVEKWLSLPEVFRIPKKERIEQMKEHEREADMKYMALGLHIEDEARAGERRNESRYKNPKEEPRKIPAEIKRDRGEDHVMSKAQRRRLFAMQAAEQMAVRRRMDEWSHHEFRCTYFGLDPFGTAAEDIPSWVDPETGQWYAYDLTEVETPKSYAHIPAPARPASINIEDYELPPLDLPDGWEYALDQKGQIYYYHRKIRLSQWEPPIKILPLGEQQDALSVDNVAELPDVVDYGDSSTTDTYDSEEEALEKKISKIKELQKMGIGPSVIAKLHFCDPESEEEAERGETEEKTGEMGRGRCRTRLAEYREISPRREEDKLYSQMEMKRYRETKEKLRRRKEALRRRKMTTSTDSSTAASEVAAEDEDKDMEEVKKSDEAGAVCDSTSDLLIEKIVLGNSRVDELDEPLRHAQSIKLKQKLLRKKRNMKHKSKSHKKVKLDDAANDSQDAGAQMRKIKELFKTNIAGVIVQHLNPYRKETCTVGRITNNEDFKHLARKLSHFVMLKELKHCNAVAELTVTESVKIKSREFIRKYMAKFGETYVKPENEPEFKE
uniref:[histone H3]-lysine(36) N-trimethyltransferase n=2 Tax=Lutzomyia longipalpis TaxID=7200 RepID=A0A1B0CJ95_LUTLO